MSKLAHSVSQKSWNFRLCTFKAPKHLWRLIVVNKQNVLQKDLMKLIFSHSFLYCSSGENGEDSRVIAQDCMWESLKQNQTLTGFTWKTKVVYGQCCFLPLLRQTFNKDLWKQKWVNILKYLTVVCLTEWYLHDSYKISMILFFKSDFR
jgi:hypothetical protein